MSFWHQTWHQIGNQCAWGVLVVLAAGGWKATLPELRFRGPCRARHFLACAGSPSLPAQRVTVPSPASCLGAACLLVVVK